MAQLLGGSKNFTGTGSVNVGTTGNPVTVYSYSFLSGGGGAGVVIFKDTTSSGAERHQKTGTVSLGTTVVFGNNGKYFPAGCNLTIDANTTYVDVDYAVQA